MSHPLRKIAIPSVVLMAAILFDGAVTALFQAQLVQSFGYMIPRMTVIVLLMFSFYFPPKQLLFFSLIFGFIYDSYYSGILGIYTAYFTIMTYGISKVKEVFFPNLFIIGMVGIISLTAIETFVYMTYQVISVTNLTMMEFAAQRLGPTLLLNACFFIISYYPLKKLLSFVFDEEN